MQDIITSAVEPILNKDTLISDKKPSDLRKDRAIDVKSGEQRVPPQVIINLEISNPTFISNNNYNLAVAKSPEEKLLEEIKSQN